MSMLPIDFGVDPQAPMSPMGPIDLPGMKQGGMFGNNKLQNILMAAAAGFLSRRSPQVAQSLLEPLQLRQQMAMQQQLYQQKRNDAFDDFKREYDYKAAHPAPINNDTVADYDFWKRTLPPDQFDQWLQNKINPPQLMNIPGVGIVQIPRQAPQGAPTAPVGKLTPIGGPSPSGSGGFSY